METNKYENKSQFIEKIGEVDKPLAKLTRKNKWQRKQISNIRNKKGEMIIYIL